MPTPAVTLDAIENLCKRRGFIFPGSEIYGGLKGTFDFGPLGAELKRNVKDAWWRATVLERDDMEGLDATILMNPRVWEASGHVATFSDPMVDCKLSKKRYRADQLPVEEGLMAFPFVVFNPTTRQNEGEPVGELLATSKKDAKQLLAKFAADFGNGKQFQPLEPVGEPFKGQRSPDYGGRLTDPRPFNLMFKTNVGPVEDGSSIAYLRPETAQGIFVNFENVRASMRRKLPFGIAQVGKSFRNEITPRHFIFRVREFEQMEIEFFCHPTEVAQRLGVKTDEEWHEYWIEERRNWYKRFGMNIDKLHTRRQDAKELAHYAKGCADLEYEFPTIGFQELEGIANRTNYDLKQHQEFSGKRMEYFNEELKEHYIPYVIEPSAGADRATLAFLCDAYREEVVKEGDTRNVLKLHPALAPIKAAILPLAKNNDGIVGMAEKIAQSLRSVAPVRYDDTAGIGKLYRRQDEVGTPVCFTVDHQSLEDHQITARDRDTMQQERIAIDRAADYLRAKLAGA